MPESSASPHDGSDHESIDLLLSPSDGYFSEGYVHPGEVLVPVPTPGAMTIEKEGKAQQKPRSPSRMNVLQSIRTDIASHPRSPESSKPSILQGSRNLHQPINEYRHLMSSAPPAYSPPESGVLYHQHTRNVTSTGMHESSGRTQLLFPNLMENMGGETTPLLRDYDDKKHWSYRLNEWCRKNSYKVLKYIVLALGIIITISMIVMLAAKLYEKTERGNRNNDPKIPHTGGIPSTCEIVGSSELHFVWAKSEQWKIQQIIRSSVTRPPHTYIQNLGEIRVRASPDTASADIEVDVVYHYSSHAVAVGLAFSMEDESLTIFTPQLLDIPQYRPCLYLDVTVWVKPGLKQERFAIDSSTLDVIFEQNHTALAEEVLVSAVTGSVRSIPDVAEKAHWGGRDIHIITDASSIDGTFPLYDSLYLETKAGDINTDLTLHHGRDGLESEALLTLRSQAGSIRANTPLLRAVESGTGNATLESIPKRDYHTEVVTHAGKVDLKLVHGSHTAIDSAAGLIHAELTPWLDPQKESRIIAKTKAGDIKITIRDAIAYKDQALRNLFGDYHFIAGSLTLRYPAEWEGEVKGNLIAGSMNIDWPGLQILKRGREGLFNHFEARKGMGNANIIFEGVSGSALLLGKGGSRYPNTTHVMEDGDH